MTKFPHFNKKETFSDFKLIFEKDNPIENRIDRYFLGQQHIIISHPSDQIEIPLISITPLFSNIKNNIISHWKEDFLNETIGYYRAMYLNDKDESGYHIFNLSRTSYSDKHIPQTHTFTDRELTKEGIIDFMLNIGNQHIQVS